MPGAINLKENDVNRLFRKKDMKRERKAVFHLPGLFEFYELYRRFLPLYRENGEYFRDGVEIGSIYGAPADCVWGGGRVGFGDADPLKVAKLMREYKIGARLTFSNSLLRQEHLSDRRCNELCELFEKKFGAENGIIITSDLLLEYIKERYPGFYFVSSTTKVLTGFEDFKAELERPEFSFVVPDFRLNRHLAELRELPENLKEKTEFLCNECCYFDCYDRKNCYENVSRKSLGEDCGDHICVSPDAKRGYRFSDAFKNPGFIGINDIIDVFLPAGFSNFKLEGRSLGSAVVFEILLYYLVKPEWQLRVREEIYLDSSLDLF